MTAVTRWHVKHSVNLPGAWHVHGTYGNGVVKGTGITFLTWQAAMDYANSKVRWHRLSKAVR